MEISFSKTGGLKRVSSFRVEELGFL